MYTPRKPTSPSSPLRECPSPYLAPTKESLQRFAMKREQWRSRPRPKLRPFPETKKELVPLELPKTPDRPTKPQKPEPVRETHKERLIAFYKRHNPSKLDSVDTTLAKYKGKETEMWAQLHQKYRKYNIVDADGPTCFLTFSNGATVHIQTAQTQTPYASRNFVELCRTEKYKDVPVHRVVANFCVQTGDTTTGDGTGGRSIFPASCKGPVTDLWGQFSEKNLLKHELGVVSMANRGKVEENGSQFFVALKDLPNLNGKHVVFGRVIHGLDAILAMGQRETDEKQRPVEPLRIVDCGVLSESKAALVVESSISNEKATAPVAFGSSNTPSFSGQVPKSLFGSKSNESETFKCDGAFGGGAPFGSSVSFASLAQAPTFGDGTTKANTTYFSSMAKPLGTTAEVKPTPSLFGQTSASGSSGFSFSALAKSSNSTSSVNPFGSTLADTHPQFSGFGSGLVSGRITTLDSESSQPSACGSSKTLEFTTRTPTFGEVRRTESFGSSSSESSEGDSGSPFAGLNVPTTDSTFDLSGLSIGNG